MVHACNPATWEAEAGEWLELRRQSLRWAKIAPLHSSLCDKSEAPCQKKKVRKFYKPYWYLGKWKLQHDETSQHTNRVIRIKRADNSKCWQSHRTVRVLLHCGKESYFGKTLVLACKCKCRHVPYPCSYSPRHIIKRNMFQGVYKNIHSRIM